jgi:Zn-dependent M32 family carboxypeptidase
MEEKNELINFLKKIRLNLCDIDHWLINSCELDGTAHQRLLNQIIDEIEKEIKNYSYEEYEYKTMLKSILEGLECENIDQLIEERNLEKLKAIGQYITKYSKTGKMAENLFPYLLNEGDE